MVRGGKKLYFSVAKVIIAPPGRYNNVKLLKLLICSKRIAPVGAIISDHSKEL